MTRLEYLKSVLTDVQIVEVQEAINRCRPILITSDQVSACGKSTLVKYLKDYSKEVYELDDMLVIKLDKPLKKMDNHDLLSDFED